MAPVQVAWPATDDESIEFQVSVAWKLILDGQHTEREHYANFKGQHMLPLARAVCNGSGSLRINPEELFVAAIASCQMMTYVGLASNNGLQVLAYHDEARAMRVRRMEGVSELVEIVMNPVVTFQEEETEGLRSLAIRLVSEAQQENHLMKMVKANFLVRPLFMFGGLI